MDRLPHVAGGQSESAVVALTAAVSRCNEAMIIGNNSSLGCIIALPLISLCCRSFSSFETIDEKSLWASKF